MSIYLYKYIYVYHIFMSTSERLSRFDLKIYDVSHQERIAVDGDITSH
jgi:hypothetical protein